MTPSTLYTYTSPSHPDITVYYLPLGRAKQRRLRQEFDEREDDLYLYLEEIFARRVVMFTEHHRGSDLTYMWPAHDYAAQEKVLTGLPEVAVMEIGAHVIGAAVQIMEDGIAYFLAPEDVMHYAAT